MVSKLFGISLDCDERRRVSKTRVLFLGCNIQKKMSCKKQAKCSRLMSESRLKCMLLDYLNTAVVPLFIFIFLHMNLPFGKSFYRILIRKKEKSWAKFGARQTRETPSPAILPVVTQTLFCVLPQVHCLLLGQVLPVNKFFSF